MSSAIEAMKKHIKPDAKVTIGDDTFILKPLNYQELPVLWKVITAISQVKKKADESDIEFSQRVMSEIDKDVMADLTYLCIKSLMNSYPEVDEDTISRFVSTNLLTIASEVLQLNTPDDNK